MSTESARAPDCDKLSERIQGHATYQVLLVVVQVVKHCKVHLIRGFQPKALGPLLMSGVSKHYPTVSPAMEGLYPENVP